MTLEWIDPPRNWQDKADDLIAELQERPGEWALIHRAINHPIRGYCDYLEDFGIDWRTERSSDTPSNSIGFKFDMYARAPKEA